MSKKLKVDHQGDSCVLIFVTTVITIVKKKKKKEVTQASNDG